MFFASFCFTFFVLLRLFRFRFLLLCFDAKRNMPQSETIFASISLVLLQNQRHKNFGAPTLDKEKILSKANFNDQRGNSRTYTYVEVSGHNLESSQTWGFYHSFLPFYKVLFKNKLEFYSLIDCFAWISETIGAVWFSIRFFCFIYNYKCCLFFICKHCLDIRMIYN